MQKIQSYLYPNRVILLADLAGFTVENTIVYARTIKIYNGIDNVIQFDIQNADQKRIDLFTLGNIEMNVMDMAGNALPESPYTVTPLLDTIGSATNATRYATLGQDTSTTIRVPTANITGIFSAGNIITGTGIIGTVVVKSVDADIDSAITIITVSFKKQTLTVGSGLSIQNASTPLKGLGTVTIPADDLVDLVDQTLRYSVTAVSGGNDIMLYCDSRFSAVGTIELIGNAIPTFKDDVVYDSFSGEINFMGNVINHTSAIPCKFYEAVATDTIDFEIKITNFIGTIYVEATHDSTIAVESFKNATRIQSFNCTVATTTTVPFNNVAVTDPISGLSYNYMRISWMYPDVWQNQSKQDPTEYYGLVNTVTVIR